MVPQFRLVKLSALAFSEKNSGNGGLVKKTCEWLKRKSDERKLWHNVWENDDHKNDRRHTSLFDLFVVIVKRSTFFKSLLKVLFTVSFTALKLNWNELSSFLGCSEARGHHEQKRISETKTTLFEVWQSCHHFGSTGTVKDLKDKTVGLSLGLPLTLKGKMSQFSTFFRRSKKTENTMRKSRCASIDSSKPKVCRNENCW